MEPASGRYFNRLTIRAACLPLPRAPAQLECITVNFKSQNVRTIDFSMHMCRVKRCNVIHDPCNLFVIFPNTFARSHRIKI